MKKTYNLLKLYGTVLTLLIAITIGGYSCKKESTESTVLITNSLSVSVAKEIFYKQIKYENIIDTAKARAINWNKGSLITGLDSNVVFKVPVKSLLKPNSIFLIITKVNNDYRPYYQELETGQNNINYKFTGKIMLRGLRGNVISVKKYENGQLSLSALFESNITKPGRLLNLNGNDNKIATSPNVYYCKRATIGISIKKTANQVFPTCSFSVEFIVCAGSRPSLSEIRGKILSLACEKPYNIDATVSEVDRMLQQESMDLGALWGSDEERGEGLFDPDNPQNPIYDNPENNEPREIKDSVQNACIKDQLAHALSAQTTIKNMLNETFGGDVEFESLNLTFKDVTTLSATTSGDASRESATSLFFNIRLNANTLPNSSKEYILSTIYHEILHAYMFSQLTKGPDGKYNISSQHENMAEKYVILMTGALKIAFPKISDQEAWGLSWGGLEGTNLYTTKLSQTQRDAISEVNRRHTNKSGTDKQGTYCN